MKLTAESWIKQAEEDLRYAKEALKDGFYSWACFACQQAAEKALKAAILDHEERLEKTHRLLHLSTIAEVYVPALADLRDKLDVLNQYYGATRYADLHGSAAPYEEYDEPMAQEAISFALVVIEAVNNSLGGKETAR